MVAGLPAGLEPPVYDAALQSTSPEGDWADQQIAIKELVPIVAACAVWGTQWANKVVLVRCDNMAVVQVLTSLTSSVIISCKNTTCPRTVDDYKKEYDEATKGHKDFFIEYSTGKYPAFTTNNLPNDRCGLVYEDNFQSYFRPFSGQAFIIEKTHKAISGHSLVKHSS